MTYARNLLTRLIRLRAYYQDPAERQQTQRLLIINLGWIAVATLLSPALLSWAIGSHYIDTSTIYFPFSLLLAFLVHYLIQRGQARPARFLFVVNMLAITLLTVFPDYRVDTPFVVVLTVPLTAAGVLLRRPNLFLLALLIMTTMAVGGFLQHRTDMAPNPQADAWDSIRGTIVVVLGAVILNTLMLTIFAGSLEDTLTQQQQLRHIVKSTAGISQSLSALSGPGEELTQLVEQLRDMLGLYHVQVFMADPISGLPGLQASTGFIGRRLLEEDSLLIPDESSPVHDALRRKDPIVILDTAPESKRVGFLPATRSELLLPLRVGNLLPIGVLDLHSTQPNTFSQQMLDALITISNQMAATLYGLQQSKDLRASYQERDLLIDRLETSQREVSRMNRQLVSATWGTYLDERPEAIPGFDWSGQAVRSSEAMSDSLQRTLELGQAYLEKQETEHVLCVPIKLRGQTLGAVEYRRSSDIGWSPAALELAQAVADRLALSLENARLFEQAQMTARREQLVSQVTSQLQTASDLETLLTLAANQFQDALNATRTRVRLGLLDLSDNQA